MNGKIKGRGALSNAEGRFARYEHEPDLEALAAAAAADDEAGIEAPKPLTNLHIDSARTKMGALNRDEAIALLAKAGLISVVP